MAAVDRLLSMCWESHMYTLRQGTIGKAPFKCGSHVSKQLKHVFLNMAPEFFTPTVVDGCYLECSRGSSSCTFSRRLLPVHVSCRSNRTRTVEKMMFFFSIFLAWVLVLMSKVFLKMEIHLPDRHNCDRFIKRRNVCNPVKAYMGVQTKLCRWSIVQIVQRCNS